MSDNVIDFAAALERRQLGEKRVTETTSERPATLQKLESGRITVSGVRVPGHVTVGITGDDLHLEVDIPPEDARRLTEILARAIRHAEDRTPPEPEPPTGGAAA